MNIAGTTSYPLVETSLGVLAGLTGLAGVLCSVMIYVDTRRPYWNASRTSVKFFLTTLVLGIPTSLFISIAAAAWSDRLTVAGFMTDYGTWMFRAVVVIVASKLLFEAAIFASLRHKQHTPLKRTALLLTGDLGMATLQRFFLGIIGGIVLPLILLNESTLAAQDGFHPLFIAMVTLLVVALLTAGELMERYLFFRAVVAPKMPGAPAT